MTKPTTIATALATATAAAVLLLPTTPARAQSLPCARAIELINIAIDTTEGAIDEATATTLSTRLHNLAETTQGRERDAISAYATALTDDNITDLTPYTDELNQACN